jgi:hypothetical protein
MKIKGLTNYVRGPFFVVSEFVVQGKLDPWSAIQQLSDFVECAGVEGKEKS